MKTWSPRSTSSSAVTMATIICRSKYGCFCLSPKVTYLHKKIEGGSKIFMSTLLHFLGELLLNVGELVHGLMCARNFKKLVVIKDYESVFDSVTLIQIP